MSNEKTDKIDALVLELFNNVKKKQAEIAAASERPKWETSCTIGTGDSITHNTNIQTVTDANKLVDLYALLLAKEDYYVRAAKELGVKVVLKWQGYTFEAWKKDFKTRIGVININNKKIELADLEARLDKLISQDQRRELELAEIQKLLAPESAT